MKNLTRSIVITLCCFVYFLPLSWAVDEENCLLCHKYSGLGRIDESGNKHIYYINNDLYNRSVHGNIRCTECHAGIEKFPHGVVKKVDCANECHLIEPSTNKPFSHAPMIEKYELSVHGKTEQGKIKKHVEDLPTCIYCHENTIYHAVNDLYHRSGEIIREVMDRCLGCHSNNVWADTFFHHFIERLYQRRSSQRVVELCASCHDDEERMSRHGLKTVGTFRDTFHWQALKFGDPNAPNCINCHAPVGYLSHEIMRKEDERSAIHEKNLVRTCSNIGGAQSCHPNATSRFASGEVHPIQFKAGLFDTTQKKLNLQESIEKGRLKPFQSLLTALVTVDVGERQPYQNIVLVLIKYFYMCLIGFLISAMIIHQILDYFATRREIRAGRHYHEQH
jgi:hypothetical protein